NYQKRDRNVDEEYSAPRNVFDQPAADDGPNSGCDRTETRPRPNRASTFVFRKRTTDDRQTAWNEQGRTEALGCTGKNQLMDVGRKAAPRGRRSEQRDTNQEDSPSAVVISERSAYEQERRKQKRVSLDDPLHIHDRGVQVRLQRRQCHVHNCAVNE